MGTSKMSNEDKLVMLGYLAIALAYTTLFIIKLKHAKHSK